jgi:hypothetical protein
MKKVENVEEAVKVCTEEFLNVQFEADLMGAGEASIVTVMANPFKSFKGKNLIEAVNLYVQDSQQEKRKTDEEITMTEMEYNEQLYCIQCGEEDQKNLAYEANYGGWERWVCKCGNAFQVKAQPSL